MGLPWAFASSVGHPDKATQLPNFRTSILRLIWLVWVDYFHATDWQPKLVMIQFAHCIGDFVSKVVVVVFAACFASSTFAIFLVSSYHIASNWSDLILNHALPFCIRRCILLA
jgi:hypothetical protein